MTLFSLSNYTKELGLRLVLLYTVRNMLNDNDRSCCSDEDEDLCAVIFLHQNSDRIAQFQLDLILSYQVFQKSIKIQSSVT